MSKNHLKTLAECFTDLNVVLIGLIANVSPSFHWFITDGLNFINYTNHV